MNIDIVIKDSYDCFLGVLVAVSNYFGKNYELVFASSWSFHYSRLIGKAAHEVQEVLDSYYVHDLDKLESIHGLRLETYEITQDFDLYSMIREEIKKEHPVLLILNAYHCKWLVNNYHKEEDAHCCIVQNIYEDNTIEVVDTQLALNGVLVNEEDLKPALLRYILLRTKDEFPFQWKDVIYHQLLQIKNSDANQLDKMYELAYDIENSVYNIPDFNVNSSDPVQELPILVFLRLVAMTRKQYSEMLSYLATTCKISNLNIVANEMRTIGNTWMSVMGLMIKAFYMKNDQRILSRCADKIRMLAENEEKVYDKLMLIINEEEISCKNALENIVLDPSKNYRYNKLDISNYVNNYGVSSIEDMSCKAQLSEGERYILADEEKIVHQLSDQKIEFSLLLNNSGMNDNISCMGQSIEVNLVKGAYIVFLGCAELGNHMEDALITYEDNLTDTIKICFSNWTTGEPEFDEHIAFCGKVAARVDQQLVVYPFDSHIYSLTRKINGTKTIKNIVLPYCPNMHIFAITIIK